MSKIILITQTELEELLSKTIRTITGTGRNSKKEENSQNRIFPIQEAAEFLDLAVPTIYGLTSKNKIPHFKKGKKLYFRESELVTWIESGRVKTRAEIEADADAYLQQSKRR